MSRDPAGRPEAAPEPLDTRVDRRGFLERMTALTAAAAVAPGSLGAPARAATGRTADAVVPTLPASPRAQATDPAELTLVEAAYLIRTGELSPLELVTACLDRIERWDGDYLAFNTVLPERALDEARRLGRSRERSALRGVPLAIKDNYYTAGVPTTANSHIFRDFVPDFDATAWARLRAAGAILIGKTQMGPLATTAATTPDGERTTVNAWAPFDASVSPGGSSSGSATAVAARLAPSSTGTQTGGSITAPSISQGLTGIKPTMGRVSLHGIVPLTYTRDHPGPLARDARDAALMLQVMAGPDPADPRSLGLPPVPDFVRATEPRAPGDPRLRWRTTIGVLPDYLKGPDPAPAGGPGDDDEAVGEEGQDQVRRRAEAREGARAAFERSQAEIAARRAMLSVFEDLGARVVDVELPRGWETLTSSDFNNVRLPERSEIFLEHLRDDVRNFGVSLSAWINGLLLPATEYVRGSRARLILLRAILDDMLARCDVVAQTTPFPFDMVGLPLIAFPIGFESVSAASPRPIGAMLGGLPYAEDRLLSVAAAYQRVTDWHRRRPADPDGFVRPSSGPEGSGRSRLDLFDVMEVGE